MDNFTAFLIAIPWLLLVVLFLGAVILGIIKVYQAIFRNLKR